MQIVPDGGGSFDVKVNFNNGVGVQWLKITLIQPQGVCTPAIAGTNVRYTGAVSSNFPASNTPYLGKAVAAYAGGFVEIDWDHLNYNTIEPMQNVLFYQ
jgi:hypothetical protein